MQNTKIKKVRDFIASYPKIDKFSQCHIDWTDSEPGNYGIIPSGESVINRTEDILGNTVIEKQYNIILYALEFTIDDIVRLETSGWLEEFTEWIEEQSALGLTPTFGDCPEKEYMTAQNGMLFELSDNGQTGRYQIQIQCFYEKHYENKGGN